MRLLHKTPFFHPLVVFCPRGVFMKYPRIRQLRLERHLTQHEVAQELFVSDSSYSRLESGERKILMRELIALSLFYQVRSDYILELTDQRTPAYPQKKAARLTVSRRPGGLNFSRVFAEGLILPGTVVCLCAVNPYAGRAAPVSATTAAGTGPHNSCAGFQTAALLPTAGPPARGTGYGFPPTADIDTPVRHF